jgi:hypothetical protein
MREGRGNGVIWARTDAFVRSTDFGDLHRFSVGGGRRGFEGVENQVVDVEAGFVVLEEGFLPLV